MRILANRFHHIQNRNLKIIVFYLTQNCACSIICCKPLQIHTFAKSRTFLSQNCSEGDSSFFFSTLSTVNLLTFSKSWMCRAVVCKMFYMDLDFRTVLCILRFVQFLCFDVIRCWNNICN